MNSPGVVSKKWRYRYDISNNNNTFSIFCHVVYATKGLTKSTSSALPFLNRKQMRHGSLTVIAHNPTLSPKSLCNPMLFKELRSHKDMAASRVKSAADRQHKHQDCERISVTKNWMGLYIIDIANK